MHRIVLTLLGTGWLLAVAGSVSAETRRPGTTALAESEHGHEPGHAGHGGRKAEVKTGAVTGVVVDVACQILGEHAGPGHRGCAEGGVPVAILDDRGRMWSAINASYGSATALLAPLMGQRVRAEGWYVERNGERLISIAHVKAVAAEPQAEGGAAKQTPWVCPRACGGTGERAGACPVCGLTMVPRK